MSSENPSEGTSDKQCCSRCQHSVDVRGMVEIVCLAYLLVRHPEKEGDCDEFEPKKIKRPLHIPVIDGR